MTPHEQRKRPSYFPLYWLFNRDPDNGCNPPHVPSLSSPIYCILSNQDVFFSSRSNPRKVLEKDDKPLPSGASQFPDPTELRSLNWVQTRKVEGNINKRDEDRDVESRIHIVDGVSCCIWFFEVALFFFKCFKFQEQNSMRTIWHIYMYIYIIYM